MYLIIVNCKININKFKCVYLKFFWWFICLFLALVSCYVMLDGAAVACMLSKWMLYLFSLLFRMFNWLEFVVQTLDESV